MCRKSMERETLDANMANYISEVDSGTVGFTGEKDELKV